MTTAAIRLVDMYRALGQDEEALAAAQAWPPPIRTSRSTRSTWPSCASRPATLDEAAEAFGRLREIVDLPEHEVAALHGLIQAELARDRREEALELAREASAIDTVGRTHRRARPPGGGPRRRLLARGRGRARQSAAFLQAIQAPALAPGGRVS